MTRLRQRMSEDMQVRNLVLNTQLSYLRQVSLFARHFGKSPDLLGRADIRTYQVYLTNEKKLSPGSIYTAIAALRFLYSVTLERDWAPEEVLPRLCIQWRRVRGRDRARERSRRQAAHAGGQHRRRPDGPA
jgi:hypothetical protein